MAHNDYVMIGGQWPATTVPQPSDLQKLDQASSEAIDGDNGGTWNPLAPIIIGGAGMQLLNRALLEAPILTAPSLGQSPAVILDNGIYPRNYQYFAGDGTPSYNNLFRVTNISLRDYLLRQDVDTNIDNLFGGVAINAALSATVSYGGTNGARIAFPIPGYRMHQTSSVTAKLRFRVRTRPFAIPTLMPGFRVLRIPAGGVYSTTTSESFYIPARGNSTPYNVGDLVIPTAANGKQFRATVAGQSAAAPPAGFSSATFGTTFTDATVTWMCEAGPPNAYGHFATLPRPTTIDAYYANGSYQEIPMTFQGGAVDTTTGSYLIEVIDDLSMLDSGALKNVSNIFHSVSFTWGTTSMDPPK